MEAVLPDKSVVAANVRRLLDARGWTAADLAREVGRQNTVYRIARGDNLPTLQTLQRLAGALGVGIEEFLAEPKKSRNGA